MRKETREPKTERKGAGHEVAVFQAVVDEIASRIGAAFGGAGASDPSPGAPVGRDVYLISTRSPVCMKTVASAMVQAWSAVRSM